MILIADSGATKTDWVIDDGKKIIKHLATEGFHPLFIDAKGIEQNLKENLLPSLHSKIEHIYFYGAGCSTDTNKQIVSSGIQKLFPNASIEVNTDLLGSARALCGNKPGIACILGTGSNACLYDGNQITEKIFSLGYIIGDEGSGAHLGKTLLKCYLSDKLPEMLSLKFNKKYALTKEEILVELYRKPYPNRFLASFTKFLSENIQDEFCINLIKNCFDDFFTNQLFTFSNYNSTPVNFVGSVAFIFSDVLNIVAQKHKVKMDKILQSPMDGLIEYHRC